MVIWLVKRARPEHRAAIEWLNNHTDEGVGFILCEIKLFRIGNSEPAPKFEIIEQTNNWVKNMKSSLSSGIERKTLPNIKDMLSWGVVEAGDIIQAKGYDDEAELCPRFVRLIWKTLNNRNLINFINNGEVVITWMR